MLNVRIVILALGTTGCTHAVMRPIPCGSDGPAGGSALGWMQVAGVSGMSGRVLTPGSLAAIPSAQVSALPLDVRATGSPPGRQAITDAQGAFRIDSIAPGRYLTTVRRLGYRMAQETLAVAADSQAMVTALLSPDNTTPGCDAYQRVRVPWWKRK